METLDPQEALDRVLSFARESLGPASEAALKDPIKQTLVAARIRRGAEFEDAVLCELHGVAGDHREIANEFLAYFLGTVARVAHPLISDRLRHFLDSWDLAQSVFGDAWPELWSLEFRTRAQFVSLLTQRVSWKAATKARRETSRRDHYDNSVSWGALAAREQDDPCDALIDDEDHARLALCLMRLSDRDRQILAIRLKGGSISDVMAAAELEEWAARKAIQRAVERARREIERSGGDR